LDTIDKAQTNNNWKPAFFIIWGGQAFSLLGSQLVQFALIWWLTKNTGSATVLATATLVGLLPQVVLGPLTGALVDRWNRRVIMIVADSIIALATIGLAVLFLSGQVEIWQVYLLLFIRSTAGGFHWPAMQASTSLMVPKEHLARIQGLNQMLQGGMTIFSAPLGALLLEVLPVQGILMIDVGTAILAILPLLFIQVPQPERNVNQEGKLERQGIWDDLKEGFRYVWSWPALMIIVGMAMAINLLLTPASSLQPLLITEHFNGGALQLAWMESAWGVGIFLGGMLLSVWGGFRRRIITSLLGLIILGIAIFMIGITPSEAFILALGMSFVAGISLPIVNGPIHAVLQAVVEPDKQGRVFTLVSSLATAMTPLGLIIAGPVADAISVNFWFVIAGLLTLFMGCTGFFLPAVVHIENGSTQKTIVEAEPQAPSTGIGD
jgi:DHA3 family macrolide efflux protein-like MFS transporter